MREKIENNKIIKDIIFHISESEKKNIIQSVFNDEKKNKNMKNSSTALQKVIDRKTK